MDDKTNRVLVNVVMDRSGSMESSRDTTISGYNEYIQALRQDKDSEYTVTLTQFDAPLTIPELTISYQDRAVADVPLLTRETFQPRGNTPLYDAIGECVRRVDAKGRAVITLILTDGAENASQEFTKDTVKALIKQKESEGWTFAFLGANIDSYAVGGGLGVASQNVSNYVVGNEKVMYSNLAHSTMARSNAYRTVGMNAAVCMSFIDDSQRQQMQAPVSTTTGGRPAAPAPFQPADKLRRFWKTANVQLP